MKKYKISIQASLALLYILFFTGYSFGYEKVSLQSVIVSWGVLILLIVLFIVIILMQRIIQKKTAALENTNYNLEQKISDLKKTEISLRESEERFRLAFENANIGVSLISPDGCFIRVNPQLCRILGYTKEELEGMNVRYITHPDYANVTKYYISKYMTGEIKFAEFDKQYLHADGHIIWVQISSSLVRDIEDKPLYFISHIQDITARKHAEESLVKERLKLFSVLDTMPTFVYLQASDYTVPFANRKFRELFGEPENRFCYEILNGRKKPCETCPTFRIFDTKKPQMWEWTNSKGQTYMIYDDFFPGEDESEMVLEIGIDITSLKQTENRLKAAVEEKIMLLREVHHRVKNNMQSLIYLIDMQADTLKNQDILSAFEDLQGRIRAMALVHESLYKADDLSKIDFAKYIEELASAQFHAINKNKPVSLYVDVSDVKISINLAIPCGLIINELITNSLKYAFPDIEDSKIIEGCHYKIRIQFELHDKEYILKVSDNGIGLPPDFNWRETKSLGLKLVNIWATYQLAGKIDLDTKDGTAFTIRFSEY